MLAGWALLPVSEFETTNSDGQECPSYESSTTQVLLHGYLERELGHRGWREASEHQNKVCQEWARVRVLRVRRA